MNGEKDWHQSMTVWGGILATSAPFCLQLPFPDSLDKALMALLASLGGLMAVIGRMRATTSIAAPTAATKTLS